jgi:2-polyprenyl-3-methyl-5-hydroxy-6-metoxy-1,4-benzoquinol methylase
MPHKGWFTTAERPGDRTLDQQLCGLDGLQHECAGKTVLDVGCAEGLISHYLARLGARSVYGIEIVPGHVDMANRAAARRKIAAVGSKSATRTCTNPE